jgi:uncharacterized membrane protein
MMGGDSNERTEEAQTISEVATKFGQLKNKMEEKNKENFPVVTDTLLLMASALETIQTFHRERTEVPMNSVDYTQTIRSLINYESAALSYIENQENKYRDKLYEISGHIVDRISQKALEWGGKTALKQHYDQQKKNIEELASVVALLKSSAQTLNQFVNDEATDTLHADYFRDHKRYSNKSMLWLTMSLVLGAVFVGLIICSISATPEFISEFSKGKPQEGLGLIVLYALFPRIGLAVISLFILLAFWKNYQAYKHLEISTKTKLNVAKMMPVLRLNAENHQEYSALQMEFIRKMSHSEETGFFYQSKAKPGFGIGSAKIE